MFRLGDIALVAIVTVAPVGAWSQSDPGLIPGGLMPSVNIADLADMSPEELRAAAEDMMIQMGVGLGLDEADLRAATPDERERMIEAAAERMQADMEQRLAERFDIPFEQLDQMSEEEIRALMAARESAQVAGTRPTRSLPPPPVGGFPDGGTPVAVGEDMVLRIELPGRQGGPFLLVVADARRKRLLSQEDVTLPHSISAGLSAFDTNPSDIVVELIDLSTRRVAERYRPVAGTPVLSSR